MAETEFNELTTMLDGITAILKMIGENTEIKRLEISGFYTTSNDLVFGDIEQSVREVTQGLRQARIAEEQYFRMNPDAVLEIAE